MRKVLLAAVVGCAALAVLLAVPKSLRAQSTGATVTGWVRSATGAPLQAASVRVRNVSTGFETGSLTRADGSYTLRQLPLGGPYSVTVGSLGYRTEQRTGITLGLGEQLRADFQLQESAVELEPLVVTAEATDTRVERAGASTHISAEEVAALPAANRDFTNLAAVSPLAGPGMTLGGARGTSTALRLDGVSARGNRLGRPNAAGPVVMSLEAIREFEVSTNDYDVSQGRQGGGAVNVATKFGTNDLEGSLFTYHRNEGLTTADYAGREPSEFSLYYWGGSLGGPIVKDRLHFFVAGERREETSPNYLWHIQSEGDELAYRMSRDSLNRFLDILERKYGLESESQVGAFTRITVNTTLFSRLDWQVSDRHRLTLRNNFVDWDGGPYAGPGPGILEAKGRIRERTNATALALRSTLSPSWTNELTLQYLDFAEERTPNSGYLPVAMVRIRSDLPNGTTGNRRIQFGGNRNMPANLPERQIQLTNKSYLDFGGHTITVGTDNLLTLYEDEFVTQEQLGRFDFNSLADLEAKNPRRFIRQVPLRTPYPAADQQALDLGLFAQTEFRPLPRLSAALGLRYDVSLFFTRAEYNPVVDRELGIRTDRALPVDWNNLLPRAQLTWDVRGDRSELVKLGFGGFTAQPHHAPFYNAVLHTGMELGDITLTGGDVPSPEFESYRRDPLTIPGVPQGMGTAPAHVELIAENYEMPTNWKANLSYSRSLFDRLSVSGNLMYGRTFNNYQFFDRNLVEEPYFAIEGGRGVFVPASTIGKNGIVNSVLARKTQEVADVMELNSTAEAEQWALVLDAALDLPKGGSLSASYTYSDMRDNSFWNCCLSGTSNNNPNKGDPRDLSSTWGPSLWNVEHKAVVYGVLPRIWGIQVSGRYVGNSGTPYALVVDGDINGDGSTNNDLAFVFDPDSPATPADVAASMRAVLNNADSFAADCIRENIGKIADRNSCQAPWSQRIDLRLSKSVPTWNGQRAELIVDVFNFANLLNSEWGGRYSFGNRQALLEVEGFDAEAQRYEYSVNENIGVTRKSGSPYEIQLGIRYSF